MQQYTVQRQIAEHNLSTAIYYRDHGLAGYKTNNQRRAVLAMADLLNAEVEMIKKHDKNRIRKHNHNQRRLPRC